MQDLPDYSGQTPQQLRRLIRNQPNELSREHYLHILRQIEMSEAELRGASKPPFKFNSEPETLTLGYKIARAVALFQYGAVFVLGFGWPIGYELIVNPGTDMPVHMMLIPVTIVLLTLVGFGLWAMRYWLRNLPSQVAVRQWAYVAAIVAPFSSITYGVLLGRLMYLLNWNSDLVLMSNGLLGFYMPFILLSFWLKYKYRTDEF